MCVCGGFLYSSGFLLVGLKLYLPLASVFLQKKVLVVIHWPTFEQFQLEGISVTLANSFSEIESVVYISHWPSSQVELVWFHCCDFHALMRSFATSLEEDLYNWEWNVEITNSFSVWDRPNYLTMISIQTSRWIWGKFEGIFILVGDCRRMSGYLRAVHFWKVLNTFFSIHRWSLN